MLNSTCTEEKIVSLKIFWFFKSLGGYNEVDGWVKNGWVRINIRWCIAKEKNFCECKSL